MVILIMNSHFSRDLRCRIVMWSFYPLVFRALCNLRSNWLRITIKHKVLDILPSIISLWMGSIRIRIGLAFTRELVHPYLRIRYPNTFGIAFRAYSVWIKFGPDPVWTVGFGPDRIHFPLTLFSGTTHMPTLPFTAGNENCDF